MNAFLRGLTFSAGVVILLVIVITTLLFSWPKIAGWWMDSPVTELVELQCGQAPMKPTLPSWYFSPFTPDNRSVPVSNPRVCISSKDLLEINKMVRISDAISLLGILVAVVGLLLPVLGYLTIKRERIELERMIRKRSDKSEKILLRSVNEHKRRLIQYPRMLALAQAVGGAYLQKRFKEDGGKFEHGWERTTMPNIFLVYLNESRDIEASLIEMLDDVSFTNAIARLDSYIAPEDVADNENYIQKLKYYLRKLYKIGFIDTEIKKDRFKSFVEDKLKLRVSELTLG